MAWGDYDNDGDLDALISGLQDGVGGVTKVYQNDGSGNFTDINAGFAGVYAGKATWGDYDCDGRLDIAVVGRGIAKIYHNDGSGTFSDINAGLAGVNIASTAWGDYDNDGDLDIVISGRDTTSNIVTKLYRNEGSNSFVEQNAGLQGLYASAVAWGDYDSDGRLDIVVSGLSTSNSRATKIYHNDGNGSFTDINAGLPGLSVSAAAWGDYDNDGDLDLALAGHDGSLRIARIFRNDGNGQFTDIAAGLTGVNYTSLAWGDADNDGDLDLLLTGTGFAGPVTNVYRNDGNNVFNDANVGLTPMDRGVAAWGDYDADGDLDILQVGRVGGLSTVRVYRNDASVPNAAPSAPTGLTATRNSPTSITFSWAAAVDSETASAGLSYNLRVGTSPGASDVFSTMSHATNGLRRVASAGPIQSTSFTLNDLAPGATYYWSVQAIDVSLAGGAFSSEQTVLETNSPPAISGLPANQTVNDSATINPFGAITIADPDTQNMFVRVSLPNGGARGDFTSDSTSGWTRTVVGYSIRYERYYSPQPNIGNVVQTALRAFDFVPRSNAIQPNTNELTEMQVFVNDGTASTTATTRITTTSVNNAPAIAGASAAVAVNDNATVNPFSTLTVTDVDMQEMLISVTILNGKVRGDFTAGSTAGWAARSVLGNNITYKRYFGPQANVGAAAQAAFRALVFQPRQNAIKPGTTEATDFQVTVSDGVAEAIANSGTRVTTTSVNNPPVIGGAVANQTMNDNQTKAVFSTLTVTDPDTQQQFVRITITNGTTKGDFTAASTSGWTRKTSAGHILYERFFTTAANNGAVVQDAIRALVYQPRTNVPTGTAETTSFTVFVNDGIANMTDSTASVITTGVAPRPTLPMARLPATILDHDIATIIVPADRRIVTPLTARLLKKPR